MIRQYLLRGEEEGARFMFEQQLKKKNPRKASQDSDPWANAPARDCYSSTYR